MVVSTRAHIVVSPHPDDAALGCGAAISALSGAGAPVTVLTCFSGAAEPPFSPLAHELHQLWGDLADPPAERAREDAAACAQLGASVVGAGEPDAIYRRGMDGDWLYPDIGAVFGPVHPEDRGVPARLAEAGRSLLGATPARVLAPLGVGGHADHVLARQAGERLAGTDMSCGSTRSFRTPTTRARGRSRSGKGRISDPPRSSRRAPRTSVASWPRSAPTVRSTRCCSGSGPVRVDEHERLWIRGTGSAV